MKISNSEEPNLQDRVNAFTQKFALNAILTVEEVQSLPYQGTYYIPENVGHLVPARQTTLQALAQIPVNIRDSTHMSQAVQQCRDRLSYGMQDRSAIPRPSRTG